MQSKAGALHTAEWEKDKGKAQRQELVHGGNDYVPQSCS